MALDFLEKKKKRNLLRKNISNTPSCKNTFARCNYKHCCYGLRLSVRATAGHLTIDKIFTWVANAVVTRRFRYAKARECVQQFALSQGPLIVVLKLIYSLYVIFFVCVQVTSKAKGLVRSTDCSKALMFKNDVT